MKLNRTLSRAILSVFTATVVLLMGSTAALRSAPQRNDAPARSKVLSPMATAAAPSCTLPGVQVQNDASNDQLAGQGNANQQLDLQAVFVAGPFTSASDHSITFLIKKANLTGGPQINSSWAVYMNVNDTNGMARTIFFDMNTIDSGTGAVTFNYGYQEGNNTTSQGAGSVITGSFLTDGTITLKVNTSAPLSFSNIAAQHQFDVNLLPVGTSLTAIQGRTQFFLGALGNGGSLNTDSTTQGTGTYVTIGNSACQGATPTPT